MKLLSLATTATGLISGPDSHSPYAAPFYKAPSHSRIASNYLVGLKPHANAGAFLETYSFVNLSLEDDDTGASNAVKHFFTIYEDQTYEGLAGRFQDEVIQDLLKHPDVAYIEEDQIVQTQGHQHHATWGLARISHHRRPSGKEYEEYSYDSHAGKNVTVYVIDTGVFIEHEDFEGRARFGHNFVKSDPAKDLNGHGTHCAGTIAGKTWGVAKKANIVAVKVLDGRGSGSMSDVVKGVEWAIEDHMRRLKEDDGVTLSAANMSLGGGLSPTLNRAVNAAVSQGIHFAVAAGNDDANACLYSPASATNPMTVGASTKRDSMAYFSNHGKCVDIFAPGFHIKSTWIGSKNATNVISGTSMASPHIAGLLALHISVHCINETCTTDQVKEEIISGSTSDVLRNLPKPGKKHRKDWPFPWEPEEPDEPDEGKTPNKLAYVIDEDEADMQNGHMEVDELSPEEAETLRSAMHGYHVRMRDYAEGGILQELMGWIFG